MNVNMFSHPAVTENLEILRSRGVRVVEPGEGYLACGWLGKGRLAEVPEIVEAAMAALARRTDLEGETVLVTAGPTIEDIDPVRFVSNRSSGRMGYRIAEAARDRGARVILVSGPTSLRAPGGLEFVGVRSAEDMAKAVGREARAEIGAELRGRGRYYASLAAIGVPSVEVQSSGVSAPLARSSEEHAAPTTPNSATLVAIREDLGDCRRCKLSGGRKSIVFGQGDPNAQLMFVGEAPGSEEDEQGLAFVG